MARNREVLVTFAVGSQLSGSAGVTWKTTQIPDDSGLARTRRPSGEAVQVLLPRDTSAEGVGAQAEGGLPAEPEGGGLYCKAHDVRCPI